MVKAVPLDALWSLSLHCAEWFVVVAALGLGPSLQAGWLAGCGQWVCFTLGPPTQSPFKGKGSVISLALGVNGLARSLLMAFAGCAFSMRSFQNYIPVKLCFTQDVKLGLC